ncbi:Nucleotide-sugar transporter [Colletotrichum higginsianum IMI 349063]|uniref:Nucleotide-sugar transporter n=1 Tax=Colletotrichum higginsianum (strain IMI 349063) TaxID=759273 RepID=A0A1B7YTA4_COLHI|nr:Nucleotide-sugar transporter [Colletotrichum higginsianum IMI 349063]OBR15184.1 Nucleotide-sugar transporter [Colletotrichum higginsianum IMI 349063]
MALIRSLFRQAHAAAAAAAGPVAGLVPCLAALGLVLLQAGAAVSVWNARERGQFDFSPSSGLALSELLRFLVATLLLRRAIRRRAASAEYASLDDRSDDLELDLGAEDDGRSSSTSEFTAVEKYMRASTVQVGSVRAFWRHVWGDADVRFGLLRIALLQMLSNNLMFLNYLVTDPGTVYLTKSGIAVAAALVTTPAFGLKGPKTRWMAFLMQTSGLVISQFMPQHRTRASTYRLSLYTGLVGQASFGALSDIYSERLLKGTDLGINGVNVVLGALGAVLNLLVHALVRYYNIYEPAFFDGYGGKGALVVVMMAITALVSNVAYKKADTWVRWLTNDATGMILLLVSARYFSAQYSHFLIPGTALIYIASLAYMKYAPIKDHGASPADYRTHEFPSPTESKKKLKLSLLTIAGFLGAGIVPFATLADPPHTPEYRLAMRDDTDGHCLTPPASIIPPFTEKQEPYQIRTGPGNLTASPFSNTLAMIRWNAKRMERVPLLQKYKPFFHTVHISMPDMMEDQPEDYHNLTHSQYPHHETVYMQVAHTMRLLLDEHPDVEGLLYFHFDSWIDPLAWVDENRQSIWYPTSQNTRQFAGDGPRYMCMTDTRAYPDWWRWSHKWNERAVTANGEILRMGRGYTVDEDEFCVGWSDIFYVPRRFFADFIFLSYVYGCADLFHEVAIPTMLNVIDRSRRSEGARFQSVIDRIGDCWGGCCDDSATAHDVRWTRCGHRLSYLNQEVVDAHYSRLDEQTAWLAQTERAKSGK